MGFIKDFVAMLVAFTCGVFIIIATINLVDLKDRNPMVSVQYDCRLVEISPDFPQEVRKLCREKLLKRGN